MTDKKQTDLDAFRQELAHKAIPPHHRPHYERWRILFLNFCQTETLSTQDPQSIEKFALHLQVEGKPSFQQKQAVSTARIHQELHRPANPHTWEVTLRNLERAIITLHYSKKTLASYLGWTKRFQNYLNDKDPKQVEAPDAAAFFTYLAVDKRVAASTQNQAFNALLFLFTKIWKREFKGFDGVVRSKRAYYIPTVLSRQEVSLILKSSRHPYDLILSLMYGCGLRLSETVNIRINSLCFENRVVTIRNGKGKKDRVVPMPKSLILALKQQTLRVERLLERDLKDGFDGAFMPDSMAKKYAALGRQIGWQWLFPARKLTRIPASQEIRRYHAHENKIGDKVKEAATDAGLQKRVTAHTLRHSYATHLLQANYDIRTIQTLLGHTDVKTTMIYTHTVPHDSVKAPASPLDF